MLLRDWSIGWNVIEQLVSAQQHESGLLTHAGFPSLLLTKSDLSICKGKERYI